MVCVWGVDTARSAQAGVCRVDKIYSGALAKRGEWEREQSWLVEVRGPRPPRANGLWPRAGGRWGPSSFRPWISSASLETPALRRKTTSLSLSAFYTRIISHTCYCDALIALWTQINGKFNSLTRITALRTSADDCKFKYPLPLPV